jgi:hypothetical protein
LKLKFAVPVKRHLRFFTSVLTTAFAVALLVVNWRLHYRPETKILEGDTVNYDQLCQLRYLRHAIENNAAHEMQAEYPEGYLFFNALYGLSWIEFAEKLNKNTSLYAEAHVELQRAFNNVNGEEGRMIFDASLPLPYGAFYVGWSTFLLGNKLNLETPSQRDTTEIKLFRSRCTQIAQAIQNHPFAESYYGSAWPADVVLCVAALSTHDKLFNPTYETEVKTWISSVKTKLDSRGLIPHKVNPITGATLEAARGSSSGLVTLLLPDIDERFAREQFVKYKQTFVEQLFGLYGIREFAHDTNGEKDVDSGPLILGMGGAATIVGIKTMKRYRFHTVALALRNGVEAFSCPWKSDGRKKYFFGKVPMADVFIAWSGDTHNEQNAPPVDFMWRTTFHAYSAIILLSFSAVMTWIWFEDIKKALKKRKKRSLR